ncbi:MAG: SurA N-terminal domain-containing protein [Hyphomicrobiales bacterium]
MFSAFRSFRYLALSAFVVATISSGGIALAQSKIVALVNDQPITTYELSQRLKLLKLTTRNGSRKKALDELIEEKLKIGEASRRGINVSPQEVDGAFASIAKRTKMSPSQLGQALNKSGVNPSALKGRLKAELAWSRVVRARFRSTVKVEDADVIASVRALGEEQRTIKEYTLKQVIFIVPSGSKESEIKAIKRRADKFRPTIAGCEAVGVQAEGMRDVVVKNVGRRDETQLSKPLVEKLSSIEISQGTEAGRIKEGYEILVLCGIRDVASNAKVENEVRAEMMDKEGQLLARRYIRDLRQEAIIDIR